MSETMPDADDAVKGGDYRKHTIAWKPAEWQRIKDAADRLGSNTHIEVAEVDFIRGAALRRADEILGEAA